MSNLEEKISCWRRQMLAAGIESPVPLDELEAHLREEIEENMKAGAGEEAAFHSAANKIGPARAVQTEFLKVGPVKIIRSQKWIEGLFLVVSLLISLVVGQSVLLNHNGFLSSAEQSSSLAATAVFSLLIWGGWLGSGIFPVIRTKRTRDIVTGFSCVPLILWWITFTCLIIPHCDFTVGSFLVTFMWGFLTPGGVVMGINLGIEGAARRLTA